MKISIKELQEMVRKELMEAKASRPTNIHQIKRSLMKGPPAEPGEPWHSPEGEKLYPVETPPEKLVRGSSGETRIGDEGEQPSGSDAPLSAADREAFLAGAVADADAAIKNLPTAPMQRIAQADRTREAYQAIGGLDPEGFYSKLGKIAVGTHDHLTTLQGHRNAKQFNLDEILHTLKQLKKAIGKVNPEFMEEEQ